MWYVSILACSKALDVGIILDESGSVGSSNFKIALGAISDLVSHYSVSSSGTHFGMITYDSNPTLHFTMGNSQYQNIIDLKSKVESIRYTTNKYRVIIIKCFSTFFMVNRYRVEKKMLSICLLNVTTIEKNERWDVNMSYERFNVNERETKHSYSQVILGSHRNQ